jgi:hypothetical protein
MLKFLIKHNDKSQYYGQSYGHNQNTILYIKKNIILLTKKNIILHSQLYIKIKCIYKDKRICAVLTLFFTLDRREELN